MISGTSFKVVLIQTTAAAGIVLRNGAGKKLFDLHLSGVSISVAVPSDADIRIEPDPFAAKKGGK
jgi:hypothetical protein